jgi:hypothetical protein
MPDVDPERLTHALPSIARRQRRTARLKLQEIVLDGGLLRDCRSPQACISRFAPGQDEADVVWFLVYFCAKIDTY